MRIRFMFEICFQCKAPHIYHFLNINFPALNIPPNSYTISRSDPALIEDTAFIHVRALRGDGRSLASACACED